MARLISKEMQFLADTKKALFCYSSILQKAAMMEREEEGCC